ncbi:MAG TPA: M15 family metallopeptidase [Caulobacteraceae bacterium]
MSDDLELLAPAFRETVERALAQCRAQGIEAKVFEAYRSAELQALYYKRGRTIIPPHHTVTNAPTNLKSWHGYGLALDVVHRTRFWEPEGGERWFGAMAAVFKRHGCKWGGDWRRPDTPHIQWGPCKPSPSDLAREIIAREGVAGVWRAVGAG